MKDSQETHFLHSTWHPKLKTEALTDFYKCMLLSRHMDFPLCFIIFQEFPSAMSISIFATVGLMWSL